MSSSRTYRSELRDQQAQHTRAVIAREARARFVTKGWAGTSVRSVAEAAGVSEATVYNVYGSKAGLAVSLIDAAEDGADVRRAGEQLAAHAGDPGAELAAFVGFDRRLYEHGGDVLRVLGEGRRQHAELGDAYDEGRRRGDAERRKVFADLADVGVAHGCRRRAGARHLRDGRLTRELRRRGARARVVARPGRGLVARGPDRAPAQASRSRSERQRRSNSVSSDSAASMSRRRCSRSARRSSIWPSTYSSWLRRPRGTS